MNRRDKQLLLTSKKLRALVPPFYSFRKEKNKGKLSVSPPRPCSKLCADEQVCTTFLF